MLFLVTLMLFIGITAPCALEPFLSWWSAQDGCRQEETEVGDLHGV